MWTVTKTVHNTLPGVVGIRVGGWVVWVQGVDKGGGSRGQVGRGMVGVQGWVGRGWWGPGVGG